MTSGIRGAAGTAPEPTFVDGPWVGQAARPAPGRPLAADEADIGAAPGPCRERWVRLIGPEGHGAHVRLATPAPVAPDHGGAPSGDGIGPLPVRLGRGVWSQLRARPGDPLQVELVDLPACEELRAESPLALSDVLRDRAVEGLRRSHAVVSSGTSLSLPLLGPGSDVSLVMGTCQPDPSVVGQDTVVVLADPVHHGHGHSHGGGQFTSRALAPATLGDFGGAAEVVSRLTELLSAALHPSPVLEALSARPPRGIILHGPPGTGKTLLARVVASELGVHVMALSSSELVGTYSGETEANLRTLFDRAAEQAPTLIVVDEIDVLTTRRERLASMADVRAASQFLTLLDGLEGLGRVVVLGTTNRLAAIDEAFRRPGRFDVELAVLPPDEPARREILAVHTRDMPLSAGAEEALERFALSGSAGMTGADLMQFAREVSLSAARRLMGRPARPTGPGAGRARAVPAPEDVAPEDVAPEDVAPEDAAPEDVAVEAEDVVSAAALVRPSLLRGLRVSTDDDPSAWTAIVGMGAEKAELEVAAEALAPDARSGYGVLLAGPPGSGKSTLLRALAAHAGATYLEVDGTAVFTQWLGESEAELRAAFTRAREVRPVVVGLEHLEALAPRRAVMAGEASRAADRVLGALLSEIDDTIRVGRAVVIGVTDRPDLVDPAVLRAGRLGVHVTVALPTEVERRALVLSVAGERAPAGAVAAVVEATAGEAAAAVLEAARLASRKGAWA